MIIVRGCSVTAKAQHDCEKAIARLRREHAGAQIIAIGCLPDAIDGLKAVNAFDLPGPVPMSTSRGYIKIQDGCNGRCAFCIVPRFRNKLASVPFEDVIARAQAFLAAGFRELVVTGCNLALYRDGKRDLADLLAALAELPPPKSAGAVPAGLTGNELLTAPGVTHRIRIGSVEPGLNEEKLIETLASHENICRFIHLSLQSGSNRILKLMNRPYTAEKVEKFCRKARERIGNRCAFGADVITGFPGETAADHEATARFLQMETDGVPVFSNLHVFPYSERPGTPAATFPCSVPVNLRRERAGELEKIGRTNRNRFISMFDGQDVVVCIEKDGNGWTGEYLRVDAPTGLPRRSLQRLRFSAHGPSQP